VRPEKRANFLEVIYSPERWKLFEMFRKKALKIISALEERHICAIVHGSVARGDVKEESDVDVFVPNPPSSFLIENALEQAEFSFTSRSVVQATPIYAMKAYIGIDEATSVSFPLMNLRRVEREFYRFSGEVDFNQLKNGLRVLGVDKRLMLIEPSEAGHLESSIIGQEEQVARHLGVTVETVFDRTRALIRRDAIGRTGVFVKRELLMDETFELVLKHLVDENPAVRRRLGSAF
jgi:predicted nucleotidyltransferase